jgi:hypothetical protein
MSHPLDDWIASLDCVRIPEHAIEFDDKYDEQHDEQQLNLFDNLPPVSQPELPLFDHELENHESNEVVAYVNTRYDLAPHHDFVSNWSVDQVRLLRMIYRPSQNEISKFLEDWGGDRWLMDGDDDLDEEEMKKRESWLCPLGALMQGSSLSTVELEELFSIDVAIDATMNNWTLGWFATALTKDLAVLSYWHDGMVGSSFWHDEMVSSTLLPEPLGLVTRENIFRSAALLFTHHEWKDYDRFRTEGNFYDEIFVSGINIVNIYRLLLAFCEEGGDTVVKMSSKNIVNYHNESMLYSFEEVARVVEATERMYERYKR